MSELSRADKTLFEGQFTLCAILPLYFQSLRLAKQSGDYAQAAIVKVLQFSEKILRYTGIESKQKFSTTNMIC